MTDDIVTVLADQRRWMRLQEIASAVDNADLVEVRAALERLALQGRIIRYPHAAPGERPLWGVNLRRMR